MQNFLFQQCKSSIGNNSGSIKYRDVKFAYSRWFSEIADRVVWPLSVSRERKWPRPLIRRITAPWPLVNGCIQPGTVDNGHENVFRHRLHHLCGMNEKKNISTILRKTREIKVLRLCLQLRISTLYFLHHCYRQHLRFIAVTSLMIKKRQRPMQKKLLSL